MSVTVEYFSYLPSSKSHMGIFGQRHKHMFKQLFRHLPAAADANDRHLPVLQE